MAKEVTNKPSFEEFLNCFPPVELPFTLGEDTHMLFSKENDPIPGAIIAEYILPLEGEEETDEVTEYIACFALPTSKNYHAIVYWKAGLLNYEYKLFTFDTRGNLIAEKVIAGTTYDGMELTQTMAAIQEDLLLYLVSGQSQLVKEEYTAANSTANRFQITEEGKIVELQFLGASPQERGRAVRHSLFTRPSCVGLPRWGLALIPSADGMLPNRFSQLGDI